MKEIEIDLDRVRGLRGQPGMTLRVLAERCGVPERTLRRRLSGVRDGVQQRAEARERRQLAMAAEAQIALAGPSQKGVVSEERKLAGPCPLPAGHALSWGAIMIWPL